MIIEDAFELGDELLAFIKSKDFPFFYTRETTSEKFPFYCHTVKSRHGYVTSNIFPHINSCIIQFCEKNGLRMTELQRAAINSTFCTNDYSQSDPHIDQLGDHYVFLGYIENETAGTIIYEDRWKDGMPDAYMLEDGIDHMKVLHKTTPKINHAVCFDGRHFHAAESPTNNARRLTLVANFTADKV